VYLGAAWSNPAKPYAAQVPQLEGYLSYIVGSSFMQMLATDKYNVGRGTSAPGKVLNVTLDRSSALPDSSIQNYLQQAINSGTLEDPSANSGGVLYMVFVQPNIVVSNFGGTSQNTFYAYHGLFGFYNAQGVFEDAY
jgi:hypothetical protein